MPRDIVGRLSIFGSILALSLVFLTGIVFIPSKRLIDFGNYALSLSVIRSVGIRLYSAPLFTFMAWLAPIPLGMTIPLRYLGPLMSFLAIIVGVVMFVSLIYESERMQFVSMLRHLSHSGYMWHDVMLIAVTSFLIQPEKFWLLLMGPGAATCSGKNTTKLHPCIFIVLALISIVIIVPTAYLFIDDSGSMFIATFPAKNVFGKMISYSMILAFTKTYHLICRSTVQSFQRYSSIQSRVFTTFWLLSGTALVELWGCSAWALHLAFVSYMDLEDEKRWLQ